MSSFYRGLVTKNSNLLSQITPISNNSEQYFTFFYSEIKSNDNTDNFYTDNIENCSNYVNEVNKILKTKFYFGARTVS